MCLRMIRKSLGQTGICPQLCVPYNNDNLIYYRGHKAPISSHNTSAIIVLLHLWEEMGALYIELGFIKYADWRTNPTDILMCPFLKPFTNVTPCLDRRISTSTLFAIIRLICLLSAFRCCIDNAERHGLFIAVSSSHPTSPVYPYHNPSWLLFHAKFMILI